MSSSSNECATSQPISRPISGIEKTVADSAIISLLRQPSLSLISMATPAAAAAAAPTVVEMPRTPQPPHATDTAEDFLCSAKISLNDHAEAPQGRTSAALRTPPSQRFTPFPPSSGSSHGSAARTTRANSATGAVASAPAGALAATATTASSRSSGGRQHIPPPAPPAPSAMSAPAPRRTSMSPAQMCDFAQRLRSAVQQQRGGPPATSSSSRGGASGQAKRALSTAAATAQTAGEEECELSSSASSSGSESRDESSQREHEQQQQAAAAAAASTCALPLPTFANDSVRSSHPRRHQNSVSGISPAHPHDATASTSVPSLTSALTGFSRHPSPMISTVLAVSGSNSGIGNGNGGAGDTHLLDGFNVSSLAHYALNHSMASITTRPPATASHELVRRKINGVTYINKYRMIRTLGRGACGKVKLAFDKDEKRMVAIKTVRRADTRKRIGGMTAAQKQYNAFMREIEVMKKLRHRNIVSLYEVIDDPNADKLYLVMQYVDKGVVAKVEVRANSDLVCDPVSPPLLAQYAREMLTGLQYLHRHDVVHRDLKPDNILVSKDGHAYLADFGVAETFDTSYRQRMEALMAQSMAVSMAMSVAGGRAGGPQVLGTKGTPLFIAPELWNGAKSYGKPVDMWAMGVTLFTLLVGKLPFRSPEDITDPDITPTVPQTFSESWRVLLAGLLNRDPKARWTVEKSRGFVLSYLDAQRSASAVASPTAGGVSGAAAAAAVVPNRCAASASAERSGLWCELNSAFMGSAPRPSTAMQLAETSRGISAMAGQDEKQISQSGMGSHAFTVNFLPMPDEAEEEVSHDIPCASPPTLPTPSTHALPSFIPVAPAKTTAARTEKSDPTDQMRTKNKSDDKANGGEEEDDEPAVSVLSSVFPSPFDAAPAMARVMSGNLKFNLTSSVLGAHLSSPMLSAQSATMPPLPPSMSLTRLPAGQSGEPAIHRGRRTQHRRSNNNNNSNSNSGTNANANANASAHRNVSRSKSREPGHEAGTGAATSGSSGRSPPFSPAQTHEQSRITSPIQPLSPASEASSSALRQCTSSCSPFPLSPTSTAAHTDATSAVHRETTSLPLQQNDDHLKNPRRISSVQAPPFPASPDGIVLAPPPRHNSNDNNVGRVKDNAPTSTTAATTSTMAPATARGQSSSPSSVAPPPPRTQQIQSYTNSDVARQAMNHI